MQRFYHVQRCIVPRFKVGAAYTFGTQRNFFARDMLEAEVTVPVQGVGGMPVDEIIRDFFDPTGFSHFRNIKRVKYTADERGLLSCSLSVLTHQSIVLRELVFEEVRRDLFPKKPSRLQCVWLIPHDERILSHWCATAPNGTFRVYEVEASGNFHVGASRYLKPACISVSTLRKNARSFWSEPVDERNVPAEVLCAGEIKIVQELKVAGSSNTAWSKLKSLF